MKDFGIHLRKAYVDVDVHVVVDVNGRFEEICKTKADHVHVNVYAYGISFP